MLFIEDHLKISSYVHKRKIISIRISVFQSNMTCLFWFTCVDTMSFWVPETFPWLLKYPAQRPGYSGRHSVTAFTDWNNVAYFIRTSKSYAGARVRKPLLVGMIKTDQMLYMYSTGYIHGQYNSNRLVVLVHNSQRIVNMLTK